MLPQRRFIPSKKFVSNINKYKQNKPKFYPKQQHLQQSQPPQQPLRRSNSADNIQQQQQQPTADIKEVATHILSVVDRKMQDQTTKVNNLIELKTKYYVDQRINVLENSNDLLTRGANELAIQEDPVHSGNSFQFKYNGDTVARITDSGWLYCRNLWVNGINLMTAINSMMSTEQQTAGALGDFVKRIELKNGTFEMDIDTAVMKHLNINADDKNTLEFIPQYNSAMLISTNRSTGIQLFNPNIVAAGNFTALAFGTANNQDEYGVLRYYNNPTAAYRYIGIGMNTSTNCLSIYQDKHVVINTGNNLAHSLLCKYSGSLANSKSIRIACGDNRDTALFAYGRANNQNFIYITMLGRAASIDVYSDYIHFNGTNYINYTSTKASGVIYYMTAANVAANNSVCMLLGNNNTTANQAITIGYQHDTSNPLGWFGFYSNDKLITYDKYGNMNMNGLTTTSSISCSGLYSSADATIDGKVTCTQLDVANSVKNTWYAKLRVEDYLSNNDYIRFIMKDLGGQANIDLFHDTQYYGLRLKIDTADNTDDNKLCIYPTGVTIDGDLDCYDDVRIWETLEVAKDISVSNTSYGLRANNLSAYSGGTVTVNSNIYIDNNNQLQTDILNSAFDSYIQCLCSMEVSNEDNDAVMAADNVVVYDKLQLDGVDINTVATSADVNDSTKVNDNTIATTAYIDGKQTTPHQQVPDNPYTSIAITDNPYLRWNMSNIGTYNTNTDAVCFSEELHQFVIVGNNGSTYFSYDGFTWMSNSMNSYTWTGVVYGPTYGYIACTSSNMFLLKSTDGRTWVPYNNVSPVTCSAIAYGNGYYVVVPNGSNASYLSYTTNPTVSTNWLSFWLGSSGKWYNIAYSKKQHKFVVVGASGKYVSFDDEFTSDSRHTGQLTGVSADCHSVCYSEKLNLWIIACNNHAYCYVSTDGDTFYQHALPYSDYWHRVVWGGDRFIMTCNIDYKAAYSLDGISWYPFQVSQSSSYTSWLGLAYGNGVFVLSGNSNTAPLNAVVATYTSPNSYITPRAMMQAIYPIGSIYMSMININPGVIFGGSWTEIQNRFLYCVPTNTSSGATGGEASVTLQTKHMPPHNHGVSGQSYNSGAGSTGQFGNYPVALAQDKAFNWHTIGGLVSYNTGGENGSTVAHNNMPPYITVYAWYRYA